MPLPGDPDPPPVGPDPMIEDRPPDWAVGGTTVVAVDERPPADEFSPPELVGYTHFERIARGGMGVVFKAIQTAVGGRTVAVKTVLLRPDGPSPRAVARLAVEAEAQARAAHPAVVPVYDLVPGPRPGMVMEYLPGGSLAARLTDGPLSPAVAAQTVERVARGLAAAHTAGVIHRDVKPLNIGFDTAGRPKLYDFGLARLTDRPPDDRIDRPGNLMGTLGYMSPEQAAGRGHEAGPGTDVWSLGVTLYEALTGRRPFMGSEQEVLRQILGNDPVPADAVRPGLPAPLVELCRRCLARWPSDRPSTADVADALADWLGVTVAADDRPSTRTLPPAPHAATAGPSRTAAAVAADDDLSVGVTSGVVRGPVSPPGDQPPPGADDGPPSYPPTDGRPPGDDPYRRLRPSCLGLLNPLAWVRPPADPVQCAVFAPPRVSGGDAVLVQVYAHPAGRVAEVRRRAVEVDPLATLRGDMVLETAVRRGTELEVELALPGFRLTHSRQTLAWAGRTRCVTFGATAPRGRPPGPALGTVTVWRAGLPAGHMQFVIRVEPPGGPPPGPPAAAGVAAVAYRKVFASYASENRDAVLDRVQGILRYDPAVDLFMDILKLDPGDRWERQLYRRIDECDLFLLFWSASAKRSVWVRREFQYALARQAGDENRPPVIKPIVLERQPPDPWTELRPLHVRDPLLFFHTDPGR